MLKKLKKHSLKTFKVGIAVFIPLAVIIFMAKVGFGFIFAIGDTFTSNKIISFFGFVLLIYVLGLIFSKTNIIGALKNSLKSHSFVLRILNIFPDKNKKESVNDKKGEEVVYYFSKKIRMRGEVVNEFEGYDYINKEKAMMVVIHPHSPPMPKTGATFFEIRKDDPNLFFTGRDAADYAAYTMSYGSSISFETSNLEDEKDKQKELAEKLTAEITKTESEEIAIQTNFE